MFAVKILQGSAKERKGWKRKDFFSLFLVVSVFLLLIFYILLLVSLHSMLDGHL